MTWSRRFAVNRCNPSAVDCWTHLPRFGRPRRTRNNYQTCPALAVLLIEFERENEKAALGALGDAARALDPIASQVETAVSPAERERLWTLRHAASPILAGLSDDRRSMQVIEDGCVPLARLGEYIRFLRETAEAQDLTVVIFGHAGDGNVHVNVLPELTRRGWAERVSALFEATYFEGLRKGDLERRTRRWPASGGWLERQYGPDVLELFRGIKTQFDPHGIFNPGVIWPNPSPRSATQDGARRRTATRRHSGGIAGDRAQRGMQSTGWKSRTTTGETEDGRRKTGSAKASSRLPSPSPCLLSPLLSHGNPQTPPSLIARPQFIEPDHLRVSWKGESSDGERLAERFAGRLCYMSQHNPAGRSTGEYLSNILKQDTARSSSTPPTSS